MTVVTNNTFNKHIEDLKKLLTADSRLVVDVETNGLDSFSTNQICGVGVGSVGEDAVTQYYPFRHHQGENLLPDALSTFIDVLNEFVTEYVGYNIKFDLHFLANEGLKVENKKLVDVIVMVRLIEHSDIKDLALTPTGKRNYGESAVQYDIDTKKALRSNKWNKDFSLAPPEMLGEYCEKDVILTNRLYVDYYKKIEKSKQLPIFDIQCALTFVLYRMEQRGMVVDKTYAIKTRQALLHRMQQVVEQIYSISGEEFNISSPAQIGEIFAQMGIESPVLTPKGKPSWNEAALININHRIAGLVRQHRTLEKLTSTYVDPYLETDVMHTSFCNWGTATGRLSSRDPNLQNIPRNHFKLVEPTSTEIQDTREEISNKIAAMVAAKGITLSTTLADDVLSTWAFIGDESYNSSDPAQIAIRRLFVPRQNYSLISFDYSQMEVRVFMSYFRNETIDALLNKEDVDFHGEAAKLAFNVTEKDSQYKFYRQMAKAITFGTIYGIGNTKLAQQLGTSKSEAAQYKKKYFAGMKGSKEFFDKVVDTVIERGWIRNRYGRTYKIAPNFAYKGVNYLVQGTSADILTERMIVIDDYLESTKSNILLQVHDEIICEIHNSELDILPFEIKRLLEINTLEIPLKVDMEICSPSWATKKTFSGIDQDDSIDWENVKEPFTDSNFIDWSLS